MSDSVKAWHEMQEENKEIITADDSAKYIFVLDFEIGEVLRYDINVLCTKENEWNPDTESCEAFLYGAGHNPANIEWMVTNNKQLIIK